MVRIKTWRSNCVNRFLYDMICFSCITSSVFEKVFFGFSTWISNYIALFYVEISIHPCPRHQYRLADICQQNKTALSITRSQNPYNIDAVGFVHVNTDFILRLCWKREIYVNTQLFIYKCQYFCSTLDNVIKWKHFPRHWPFVWGIHRSRWIPHTKASDAELWCFLWSASE